MPAGTIYSKIMSGSTIEMTLSRRMHGSCFERSRTFMHSQVLGVITRIESMTLAVRVDCPSLSIPLSRMYIHNVPVDPFLIFLHCGLLRPPQRTRFNGVIIICCRRVLIEKMTLHSRSLLAQNEHFIF